eukprot:Skav234120  [mRNA]  locus=scaffold4383:76795:78649:- [translate_table: standard]
MAECAALHLKFLDLFLSSGFKSLKKIDARPQSLLIAAKKLHAACVAETSLLSAIYWICCSYALLGCEVDPDRRHLVRLGSRILTFASACRHPSGAFAPHPSQGEELLSTVSAVQLALLLKEPQLVDATKVSAYAAWRAADRPRVMWGW